MISTVSLNWGLPSLGRWDCNANVLSLVANKTSYTNQNVDVSNLYFNSSYPGPLSDDAYIPIYPIPDTNAKCAAGSILASVVSTWGQSNGTYNYTNVYPYDAASGNDVASSGTTSGTPSGTASPSASPSASAKPSMAGAGKAFSWSVLLLLAGGVAASMM
jgi:acid phosphatase